MLLRSRAGEWELSRVASAGSGGGPGTRGPVHGWVHSTSLHTAHLVGNLKRGLDLVEPARHVDVVLLVHNAPRTLRDGEDESRAHHRQTTVLKRDDHISRSAMVGRHAAKNARGCRYVLRFWIACHVRQGNKQGKEGRLFE